MCYSHSFVSLTFAQSASSWTEKHSSHGDTLACFRAARIRAVVAPWPVPMLGEGAGDSEGEPKLVLTADLVPFHMQSCHTLSRSLEWETWSVAGSGIWDRETSEGLG